MLTAEPSELASNWDFTPVFDLLRSPTRGGTPLHAHDIESDMFSPKKQPRSSHNALHAHDTESDMLSPKKQPRSSHNVDHAVDKTAPVLTSQKSHTRLGDFGSLWELLGQGQNPTKKTSTPGKSPAKPDNSSPVLSVYSSFVHNELHAQPHVTTTYSRPESQSSYYPISMSKASKPCVTKDTIAGQPLPSATRSTAVTILKRAVNTEPSRNDAICPHPETQGLTRDAGKFVESIPRVKLEFQNRKKETKSKLGSQKLSTESSGEAESDPTEDIFDQPITKKSGVLAIIPAQVGMPNGRGRPDDTPPSSFEDKKPEIRTGTVKDTFNGSGPTQVQSTLYKSATERRVFLMTKLLRDFPEYAQFVASRGSASNSPNKGAESRSVHVFVDMSNIMVGFHDSVKVSRNIPITTRIQRVHMSFANLSLIMERGRPAAKRVLVGSDRLPSTDEAETLGYETNILDRVHKVKPKSRPYKSRKPGSQTVSGKPEMASAAGERWVEQGVDEILHLKILESLIDTVEPATIVLATGDAAEAEFSGGFMCQVERVLQRGWFVELVSFSKVTSNAYRRKGFRSKWGNQFRLIELDAYVEELFF